MIDAAKFEINIPLHFGPHDSTPQHASCERRTLYFIVKEVHGYMWNVEQVHYGLKPRKMAMMAGIVKEVLWEQKNEYTLVRSSFVQAS